MVLGDPGEGDDSQYQVVRPLRAKSKDTDFTFIVADVIYPAGDVLDYHDKFYWPDRGLPGPIYAIPGNHDPPPDAYSYPLIRDFIAPIRIDLDVFAPGEIAVLENHGYLMAEIALAKHGKDLVEGKRPEAAVPHSDWLDEVKAASPA
jgi:DNA repair exonuclease SbcCD nuclease subunit